MLKRPTTPKSAMYPAPLAIALLALATFSDGPLLHAGGEDESPPSTPLTRSYNEAPLLAQAVAAGSLPPVEERISDDPLVVKEIKNIGKYGDAIRDASGYRNGATTIRSAHQTLIKATLDGLSLGPNIVRGWESPEDFTSITLYLRAGMKWSDGSDFTTADFEFWYQHILLDEDITNVIPERYRSGEQGESAETMTLQVVDPTTVVYRFARPRLFLLIEWLPYRPFVPKHQFEEFHPEHNDNADGNAKEKGYENGKQAIAAMYRGDFNWLIRSPPKTPVVDAFSKIEETEEVVLYRRNPYYWKVDLNGNQLPYIDEIVVEHEPESSLDMLVAGAIDIRVLEDNEYRSLFAQGDTIPVKYFFAPRTSPSTPLAVTLNYTHPDEYKREVFLTLAFRRALSLAIDRADMIEKLYPPVDNGYAVTPWTPSVHSHWTRFQDSWSAIDSGYDYGQSMYSERADVIELANELLDGIGLSRRDTDGWRTWPDRTDRLSIVGTYWDEELTGAMELIAGYWKEIGVKLEPQLLPYDIWKEWAYANALDATFADTAGGSERVAIATQTPIRLMPPWARLDRRKDSKYMWSDWYMSGGRRGTKPPDDIKIIIDLSDQYKVASRSRAVYSYEETTEQLLDRNVDNLYSFGTVSSPPIVIGVSTRLENFPDRRAVDFGVPPYDVDTVYVASD